MTQTTPTRDEAVPTGWKLVPVEPTDEMVEAGLDYDEKHDQIRLGRPLTVEECQAGQYRAMLASAPAPASGRVDAVALAERLEKTFVWKKNPNPKAQSWGEGDVVNETEVRAVMTEAAAYLRSLSPAATPVSEAEPVAKRWLVEEHLPSGSIRWSCYEHERMAREEAKTFKNPTTVTPLYLAKPAFSPAGGDVVREKLEWIKRTTLEPWTKTSCEEALAAHAGRVGE